jgi:hypothetical protein
MSKSGLSIHKPDVHLNVISITFCALNKSREVIYPTQDLIIFDDEKLSITCVMTGKTKQFNDPNQYLKVYNMANEIIRLGGVLSMLQQLFKSLIGPLGFDEANGNEVFTSKEQPIKSPNNQGLASKLKKLSTIKYQGTKDNKNKKR